MTIYFHTLPEKFTHRLCSCIRTCSKFHNLIRKNNHLELAISNILLMNQSRLNSNGS
ncbi:hypothetical protein Hanom_Chr01g00023121 [Helianthus anomalus]